MHTKVYKSSPISAMTASTAHTIAYDDVMHASVVQQGREILNINMSGITSLTELFKAIRCKAINLAGFVVVKIRNCSQGWCQSKSLLLA